ncbi:hypothetical protein EYF80_001737 [Liparis tanakae]|uniref:Uncharacterized protein n=1 Tax=Liparis tanakae TaxID=230148 RepID=A0A4Z2JD45_9TELE|nr:hypothetical protein EYF80_001737 [Liparis tanakae]
MQWRLHEHECTSPFLPIGQGWRYDEFPLLSRAHVLQAFIPAFDGFSDAQCKPHRLLVTFVSTGGQTDVEKSYSSGEILATSGIHEARVGASELAKGPAERHGQLF